MSKNITRTIIMYEYTYGRFDANAMSVVDIETVSLPYKMGSRELKKEEKVRGKTLINTSTSEVLYEMSVEDFVLYGHPAGR